MKKNYLTKAAVLFALTGLSALNSENRVKASVVEAQTGVAKVTYKGPGKVRLLDINGHYQKQYVAKNTRWKVNGKAVINGQLMFRLGTNKQWIPAQYTNLAGRANSTSQVSVHQSDPASHVYSHRGASGEAIEHTFASYDLAIAEGSRYIEQDVVLSGNGTLYVSHDLTAKRLTGVNRKYADMSDAEISNLRVANGEPIHTMQSVIDRYGHSVNYVIELKQGAEELPAFIRLIQANNLADKVTVQAKSQQVLDRLKSIFPAMKTLLLAYSQADLNAALNNRQIDIISARKSLMTQADVNSIHRAGKLASFWTFTSDAEVKKAISLGVDNYFTNYTGRALALERQYRK